MFSFEEQFIPDEEERLISFLDQYLTFLKRHATPTTIKNHEFISKLLIEKTSHVQLLEKIETIFVTDDGKPKLLTLTSDIEKKLGPNRSAEYLGLHADISYMVTQYINKDE